MQLDAPLLCNNACALVNNEEKTEEKDLDDFVFFLLEDGSNVTVTQVAHAPRLDIQSKLNLRFCTRAYLKTRNGGLKLNYWKETTVGIQ